MGYEDTKHWNSQFDETGFRIPLHDKDRYDPDQYNAAVDQCQSIRNPGAFSPVVPIHIDEVHFFDQRHIMEKIKHEWY